VVEGDAPPLLTGIPAAALADFERKRFRPGDVVVAEGDYPGALYLVLSGAADVAVIDRQGEEHVVGRVAAGETIGEMSLFTRNPAIGTVRATEEVELVVLDELDLQDLTRRFPDIYRNLIATLAARLARTDRLALRERLGRLVVIEDRGGPPVLARALAASVAWHASTRTALVDASGDASVTQPPRSRRREPGIDLVSVSPEALERALGELRQAYDHVLVRATGPLPPGDVLVGLGGSGEGIALDGFRDGPRPPFRDGVLVPLLTAEDEDAVQAGLLGTASPAGAAIGWLAREVSGLKVGVALGSGSLRGYAHLGALRALERNGIPIDCLAGTSIGAIVGAAYSYFRDTEQVADILDDIGRRVFRPTLPVHSLLSTGAVKRWFARSKLRDAPLEELPIPLAIVTADLVSQDEVVLERGSTVGALLAAAAIPGIFPAVAMGKRLLVDGSILNPVPVTTAAEMGAGVVVAVRLAGGSGVVQTGVRVEPGETRVPTAVATILGAIEVVQTRVTIQAPDVRTVVVVPNFGSLPEGKIRNFRAGRAYIEAGEEAVEAALPRLSAVMPWLRAPGRRAA
jgi:NTE family protein